MNLSCHPPERRWGEVPPEPVRLSGVAVMAALVAGFSLVCGVLAGLLPDRATSEGPARLISNVLIAANLFTFPAGLILGYAALVRCRLDGLLAGRALAWLALGLSYFSLLAWYILWIGRLHPLAPLGGYGIAAVILVHLLIFAAESRGGRSVLVGLLIGGALFAVVSLGIFRSIEHARRMQVQHHLMRMGKGLQEQQQRQRSAPGRPAGDAEREADPTTAPRQAAEKFEASRN